MAIELKYSKKDKTKDDSGFVLDKGYLRKVQMGIEKNRYEVFELKEIELILLTANGEYDLLKQAR